MDEPTLKSWGCKKFFQCNLSRAKPSGVTLLMQVAVLCNIITKTHSKHLQEGWQTEYTRGT